MKAPSSAERELENVWGLGIMNYGTRNEEAKMFAFLSIFHPEMSDEEVRELAREAGRKGERFP
jgi:hypothetical protein